MKTRALLFGLVVPFVPTIAFAEPFTYLPPGDLLPTSGEGRVDQTVYAPAIRFPIANAPAFLNSQVWGVGGGSGPAGSQCDVQNYSFPWRDNYCETRTWDMPLCPAGTGHQGQDIRPSTCAKDVHPAVAVVDGTITSIGSYSVYLTAADGTRFDYLHMSNVAVVMGQEVKKGELMGLVSNVFGGTPTTYHLHFNIQQNITGVGTVYVPPYMSLVQAYQALTAPVNPIPKGKLEVVSCDGISGWAQDGDTPDAAVGVRFSFEGGAGEPNAKEADVVADVKRDDLCTTLGSCAHGFVAKMPAGYFDGLPHEVHVYAKDTANGPAVEIEGSPKLFVCPKKGYEGVRRLVWPESFSGWKFDPLWDVAQVSDAVIESLPVGEELPSAPSLARRDDGSTDVLLIDGQTRRVIGNADVADAWSFDLAAAPQKPSAEIDALAAGPDVRPRPFVIKGSGTELWLVDDALPNAGASGAGTSSVGTGASSSGGSGSGGASDSSSEESAGCACRVGHDTSEVPRAGAASVFLGLLALLRLGKRRRRAL